MVAGLHESREALGARHVRALADRDEAGPRAHLEGFESAEAGAVVVGDRDVRGDALHRPGDLADVFGGRAAAAADQVQPAVAGEFADDRGGFGRRLVVLAKGVGQAGVRVAADEGRGDACQVLDEGPHLRRAERAVESDGERLGVRDRDPGRLERLAGERAPAAVGDREREDDGQAPADLREDPLDRDDRRLHVERVEARLG